MGSTLGYDNSRFQLSPEKIDSILIALKQRLIGRVRKAYIFGSVARREFSKDSDIDLILIVDKGTEPFMLRPMAFADLHDIYPEIDILVYTETELAEQLADSNVGFWKSVRETMTEL